MKTYNKRRRIKVIKNPHVEAFYPTEAELMPFLNVMDRAGWQLKSVEDGTQPGRPIGYQVVMFAPVQPGEDYELSERMRMVHPR
jgi:hypothetical protein